MPFSLDFNMDYHLFEPDLTARLPGVMFCVQETSIRNTESTDFKMQWYADNMRGWILTNWHIEVTRLPKWNETITITTWPSRFKGILADRSFQVKDAAGNPLISASSAWVFMDIEQKRLLKAPQEIVDGYGEVLPPVVEPDYKFVNREGFRLVSTRAMTVTRRDTDTNFHVNNVRYIEWAFDDIPEDIYQNCTPVTVKAAYKRECKANDELLLDCLLREGDHPEIIISIRKQGEDTPVCEVYTSWTSKQA